MIARTMSIVDGAFTGVSVVALAALTLLVVADVALRYGAGTPIFFAHDLVVLYLTPAVFFFGFGPTYWRNEHLAVDILMVSMPARLQSVSQLVSALIGLWIFGLLFWVSWERAWQSFANDEMIASIIPWPAWASYALVPVGSVSMILVCAARAVTSTVAVVTGKQPATEADEELTV